ncbi:MAG: hypothetical protein ACRD06_04970, partial [Terriglobia bacterium]
LASTLTVQNTQDLAGRFEQTRVFWQRFYPHADAVALLRARIEREPVNTEDAARWCVARGVPGPVDSRLINWEPDYEERYYRELASRAQPIYLFRNEYLFVLDDAVVAEIPLVGHASYIFRPPGTLAQFLHSYAQTNRREIRRDLGTSRKALGYRGRIPHVRDFEAWLRALQQRCGHV